MLNKPTQQHSRQMNLLGLPSRYFVEGLDMFFLPCWLTLPHVWIYRAIGWSHHDCYLLVLSQRKTLLIAIFYCTLSLRSFVGPLSNSKSLTFQVYGPSMFFLLFSNVDASFADRNSIRYIRRYTCNSNELIGGLYCRVEGPCCITLACSDYQTSNRTFHIF